MAEYTPDCWVVVRIKTPEYGNIDKVLAGWYGGYANSDSWKISSGIEETIEHETYYEFLNTSGSKYICFKNCECMSGYTSSIYTSIVNDVGKIEGASVEIVKYGKDDE